MTSLLQHAQARVVQTVRRSLSSDLKRLMRDTSWSTASSVAVSGMYLLEIMLLSRYLSKELLGIYFLIISFPELVQEILDMRVREIMVRYLAQFIHHDELRRAAALIKLMWLVDVGVSLLGLLVVAALSQFASVYVVGQPGYAGLMVLYGLGTVLGALDSAAGTILRVLGRFDLAFLGSFLVSASRLALIGLAVLVGASLDGLITSRVIAFGLSTVIFGGLTWPVVWRLLRPHYQASLAELRPFRSEMIRFAIHVNISSTIKTLATKLDVIIVGAILGPGSVAVYKVGTQLAKTLTLLSDSMITAIYPQFATLKAQGNERAIERLARQITLIMVVIQAPVLVGVLIWRRELLVLFAGAAYHDNTVVFVIATLGVAFTMVFFWIRPYLLSFGRASALTNSLVVGTIASLLALVSLTQVWGEAGAAVGFSMFYVGTILAQLWQMRWSRRGLALTPHTD